MANLRRLSVPDLQALRAIILAVLDEGDPDGKQWEFYAEDEALANNERLDFCDAIQQRIFVTEPLPQRTIEGEQ